MLKLILQKLEIVQNAVGTDLMVASAWSAATDLGEMRGKPFLKVTWEPDGKVESQSGERHMFLTFNIETSTLELADLTKLTALKAMRDKNVSLRATPFGTVSATNPMVIIQNFHLQIGGEINIGDVSFIKIMGKRPAASEEDVILYDSSSA